MPDIGDRQQWLADRKAAAEEALRQTELHDKDRKRFNRNHARFEAQMDRFDALLDKAGV